MLELNKVKLHMRMLGAKNTRALLRLFIIRKTMAVRGDSWTHDETVLLIVLRKSIDLVRLH
jgi:hypothetical protein